MTARALMVLRRRSLPALAGMALVWLAGCAQLPLGEPTASFGNIGKAGMSGTAPVSVGPFRPSPGVSPALDKGLSVRSNTVVSPIDASFAQYLRQTLVTDLQAAGLYDPASPTRVSGFLTDSTLDVPLDTGHASLGARFVVVRLGKTVYDKELKASASWPSSFVGMEAIPTGVNQYAALYHMLVGKLLDDPDYRTANPK
ncbi:MAG: hypothetical protein HY018_09455 [Hydrogenophilales bacterium]|nr:hypothetical protein [Hydrogenophilales bacterium]